MKLVILTFTLLFMMQSQNMYAQELSSYQWKNRLVLLISSDSANSDLLKQLDSFNNHEEGLKARKIVVYQITPESFKTQGDGQWRKSAVLYDKYKKSGTPFELILIGLDGGIKSRNTKFLPCKDLFAIIDAMPMRQNEIRRQ